MSKFLSYTERAIFDESCSLGKINDIKNFISLNSKKTDYLSARLNGFKLAASYEQLDVLKLLIENGETAYNAGVLSACEHNKITVLNYLIGKGADMFSQCLEFACNYNNFEMVKLLLDHEKTEFDRGLFASCKNGNMEIFKLFFKIKIGNKIKTYSSKTKGDAACIACQYGHINIVKYLIDQDVKIFTRLFNTACYYGHFELVNMLYSENVNLETGLENACHKEDNEKIINFIIDKGVITDYDASFKIAAKQNNPNNLKILLSKGASNLNDALLVACSSRTYDDYTKVINILIDHGADNIAQVLRITYDDRKTTSFQAIVNNICKY